MLKGLRLLVGFMAAFWGVFMVGAWVVAEIYLPWVKVITAGVEHPLIDFLVWLLIVILIALILIAFRYLLHAIFWREMANTQQQSP